jgi:Asp-tRNA(Asn)/Glu-tRNA(Gln) amidotransferase A subunit family amidase
MGLGRDDLPLGLEIIAALYGEATVVTLATAFQHATKWHHLNPTV